MFYQVMRTELIKLRRAPVWIAFFALTALSAVMGTFNYLNNTGILTQQWYSLWTQHTLFAGFFFLPSLLGVLCAYLWRMEHCEHTAMPPNAPMRSQRGSSGGRGASNPAYTPLMR